MTDPSVLQEIVRRIVEVAHPERIILFGSAARGEGGPESDIDLLIVKSNVHQRRLAMDLYEALAHIDQPVDLIVVTPEDIENRQVSGAFLGTRAARGKHFFPPERFPRRCYECARNTYSPIQTANASGVDRQRDARQAFCFLDGYHSR